MNIKTVLLVLFCFFCVICYSQNSCSSIKAEEYICTFIDENPSLAIADDILITVLSDEKFVVNSDNPDCSPNDKGTFYYNLDEGKIGMRIGSSCSGPVSLFNDNDDTDTIRDYILPPTCDAFSGTVYTQGGTLKGEISCEMNGNSFSQSLSFSSSNSRSSDSSSSDSSSSDSSSNDSSSTMLIVNLLLIFSVICILV